MTPVRLLVAAALLLLCLRCHLDSREFPVEGSYSGPTEVNAPEAGVESIGRVDVQGPGNLKFSGGTSFLLQHKAATYVVGAYHVLGSAESDSKITLVSEIPELAVADGTAVEVPHQSEGSYSSELADCRSRGDMAVLRARQTAREAVPLELGYTPPIMGEPVWILQFKSPPGKSPKGAVLLPGKVAYHSNQLLAIKMVRSTDVAWTSGAPVLNAQGLVVGVNIGQYLNQEGTYRIAVPTQTLRDTFADL